jgi:molecular chaperone DnaK
MLADNKEIITEDQKAKVEAAVKELRDALAGEDAEAITQKTEAVSAAMQEVGAAIYGAQQAANAPGGGGGGADAATEGEEAGTIEGEFREV